MERFSKSTLPNKKAFYSKLCLEDITDEDYIHAQKVFEEFKLKNLGEYHDLYVQSDKLLLADVYVIIVMLTYLLKEEYQLLGQNIMMQQDKLMKEIKV